MSSQFKLSRRNFLKMSFAAGTGLMLGVSLTACDAASERNNSENAFSPNLWIRISIDNVVTIIVAESDMGQGVRTSLSMLIAEELDADWSSIQVEQAQPLPAYGRMSTGGSSSIRDNWDKLRIVGATVREMLLIAAGQKWNVSAEDCYAENSEIIHRKSNQRLKFGDLIKIVSTLPLPDNVTLKTPNQFKLIGKSMPSLDGLDKVTGKAIYGIDVIIPDMLIATIAHCPVFGGKAKAIQSDKAKLIKGVKEILEIESGIVVVAEHFWAAKKGLDALEIEWEMGSFTAVDSESIRNNCSKALDKPGKVIHQQGQSIKSYHPEIKSISATYEAPLQAHATMEPMNCTVRITGDIYEIWAPTQSPTGAQYVTNNVIETPTQYLKRKIQKRLGITVSIENIKIYTTLLGGGFGRRLKQDYVIEAVQIARIIGKPVKLIWSREEDIQHDYYRPYTRHHITAKLDNNGQPMAWHHHIAGLEETRCVHGAIDLPYSISNIELQYSHIETMIPIGSWRSVGFSHNTFIIESFIDELAENSQLNPLDYRLKLLAHEPRCRRVLEIAAEKAGWHTNKSSNQHLGISLFKGFGSYIAYVVQVTNDQTLKIHNITCAVDCGIVVNPNSVRAQIEGGTVFGLTAAVKHLISIKNGMIEQANFNDYPLLSIDEMPQLNIHIVQSNSAPGGIGELSVPPIGPALVNAIYSATGMRLRSLPLNSIVTNQFS